MVAAIVECAALILAGCFAMVLPLALAVSIDAAAAVAFESLFHRTAARQMCNLPMLVAYAFYWHELQPVFVTKSVADAYRPPLNALERVWNIVIHVPSKQMMAFVSLSVPARSANAVVNVLQPANWLEYLQSMYFCV